MNKRTARRLITWLLAACMILSVPMSLYADEETSVPEAEVNSGYTESNELASDDEDIPEEEGPENEIPGSSDAIPMTEDESQAEEPYKGSEPETPEDLLQMTEESAEEAILLTAGTEMHGSFDAVPGKDVATIRYFTDAEHSAYAFADFFYNEAAGTYDYTLSAPYDNFTIVQATENVRENYDGDATVIAEYFSVDVWDGAVDVSWYDEESTDFYIDTPAKLAGLAAVVNGVTDGETQDFQIKGDAENNIKCIVKEDAALIANATGRATVGLPEHDFSNRRIHITADLDMGGADGSRISHTGYNDSRNQYSYPNWMPIGCETAADPADKTTMCLSSFNGVLDGGGHHISNLYCYRYTYSGYQFSQGTGLIGCLGVLYDNEESPAQAPSVRNLSLSGYVYGRRMVGGIVGVAGGGSNAVHGDSVGGSVTLENLANHASVYSTDSKGVGGIIASSYVDSGSIINCYNDGLISTTYSAPAGGIVGANEHMDIFCCYNRGKIDTGKNHYGRGIGGTGNSPGSFTVDSCYYLKGSGDDTTYPGYYTYNLPPSVSINTTEMKDSDMTNGKLLAGLNVNGTAYLEGDNGYPVLWWEKVSGLGFLIISDPEGGDVEGTDSGEMPNGSIVYLSVQQEEGWNFRYYTLAGSRMTGDYVTVNGDTTVSAYMESAKPGVLQIQQNRFVDISVKKNGLAMKDGVLVQVTGEPVNAGDELFEGDVLMVTAVLKEGVVPDDPNNDFRAAVGASNPYDYTFTYTGSERTTTSSPVYTVNELINGEGVSLNLEVTALETPKLWKYIPDTSWYDDTASSFTITSAAQLAGIDALVESGNTLVGKTILLGSDISLANDDGTEGARGWDGIGNSDYAFAGVFNGQGHKITEINGVKGGLFDAVEGVSLTCRAEIKNVTVYGTGTGQNCAGIAGTAKNAVIDQCSSYLVITDGKLFSAGILARDMGATSIQGCVNYGPVKATGRVAGICGSVSAKGSLTDCYNKGDILAPTAANNQVGGIAGELSGPMLRCANYGRVTAYGRNIGGLAGQSAVATASMTDSYNVGTVSYKEGKNSLDAVGGLLGFGSLYKFTNCFNYGSVNVHNNAETVNVGSFIGRHLVQTKNVIDIVYVLDTACGGKLITQKSMAELKGDLSDEAVNYYSSLSEADAAAFAGASGVLAGLNKDGCFILTNGFYPELSGTVSMHQHSGGTAYCRKQAVCEVCGLPYGETDPDNHEETEMRDAKEAVWVYDGYTGDKYCADCGALIQTGETYPADSTREVITFFMKEEGMKDVTRTYTAAQFDRLKTTGTPIAYQFGFGAATIMAATEYVTLQDVMDDLGLGEATLLQITVVCPGSTSVLSGDEIRNCCWYYDEDGNQYAAPAAFAITHATQSGGLDRVAAIAQSQDDLRFGYGVSEKQFEDKTSVGGFRMVSPVRTVELLVKDSKREELTGVEAFVTRLYNICLDREPDEAGLTGWTEQLESGKITGVKAAQGFIFSQEFKNKNYCNRHFVQQLYRAFMGREPDEGGWNNWIRKLETGSTREAVFNGFALSNEFTLLCNEYGISRGTAIGTGRFGTVPTGLCAWDECGEEDGVTAFVKRLYNVCLGRNADEGGLRNWTRQLWDHSNTGKGVSRGFVFSAEFRKMGLGNNAFVDAMYLAFFDRAADTAGKTSWVRQLNAGKSRETVFNGFADSQEFTNLCQRYGIVPR